MGLVMISLTSQWQCRWKVTNGSTLEKPRDACGKCRQSNGVLDEISIKDSTQADRDQVGRSA